MNKEIGNYYNLKGDFQITKLNSIERDDQGSHYIILASSIKEERSEIHIIKIEENDNSIKTLVIFPIDHMLISAKVFNIKQKFFLFCIGYTSKLNIGKESLFFFQEIQLDKYNGDQINLKINPKYKKEDFLDLDCIDENVYLMSSYSIYRYNFVDLRLELFYELYDKQPMNIFKTMKADKKNKRLYLGLKNNILILEEDLGNNFSIEGAHDLRINHIDVNTNKNHQILSTANENFLKFWDIRYTSMPNLVVHEKSSLISSASFNHFYDQLVLYSVENGSLFLTSANSISSSVILKLNENENIPENKELKNYESVLDDYIKGVSWNSQDAWVFGAISNSKVYFDTIPQNIRFEVMF